MGARNREAANAVGNSILRANNKPAKFGKPKPLSAAAKPLSASAKNGSAPIKKKKKPVSTGASSGGKLGTSDKLG